MKGLGANSSNVGYRDEMPINDLRRADVRFQGPNQRSGNDAVLMRTIRFLKAIALAGLLDASSRGFCPEFISRFGRSLGWWWHSRDGQGLEGASPLSGNLCGKFPRTFGATIIALRQQEFLR
jgi:hypothetical protein